jgi:hypothetical protein
MVVLFDNLIACLLQISQYSPGSLFERGCPQAGWKVFFLLYDPAEKYFF